MTTQEIADYLDNFLNAAPIPKHRTITLHTGELGMHMFGFATIAESLGVESSYLKTSTNYFGYVLDNVHKIYYRIKANKVQYFLSTLNNKILYIGKNITETLQYHKSLINK